MNSERLIVVRVGENILDLYDENNMLMQSFPVTTGKPGYETPTGVYEIVKKRRRPTWINPAPEGWGKDLPDEIPPGWYNPLGMRALNWSEPAGLIRLHGTWNEPLLGYSASHGCVRLSNPNIIKLFKEVAVGTRIVSVKTAEPKPPPALLSAVQDVIVHTEGT